MGIVEEEQAKVKKGTRNCIPRREKFVNKKTQEKRQHVKNGHLIIPGLPHTVTCFSSRCQPLIIIIIIVIVIVIVISVSKRVRSDTCSCNRKKRSGEHWAHAHAANERYAPWADH